VEQVRKEGMKTGTLIAIFLFAISLACQCVFGQSAWISPKGTYSFSISYQNNFSDRHSFGDGRDYLIVLGQKISDNGAVRIQGSYLDFGYSPTDKLAVSFDLPYLTARYENPKTFPVKPDGTPISTFGPHYFWQPGQPVPGVKLIDNGEYHGGIQDVGFRVRYNIATHPFMITPYAQYNVPSHGYEFYSHAVYGNHVAEFQIGSFLGGFLTDKTYLSGGYGLGLQRKIMGISRTHHHMELESGYFINEKIKAFGILHAQVTQGGLDLIQDPSSYNSLPVFFDAFGAPSQFALTGKGGYTSNDALFLHHLQIQRDSYLNMTLGTEYSFNSSMSVYGAVEHTLTNRNLHILKYGLTFGVSWGFNGRAQRPCHC
jgi:hypothetical protein